MPRKYVKSIKINLETEANNKIEATKMLNDVAHKIHSLGHPLTIGGKNARKVSVFHKSTNVIFMPKNKKKKVKVI